MWRIGYIVLSLRKSIGNRLLYLPRVILRYITSLNNGPLDAGFLLFHLTTSTPFVEDGDSGHGIRLIHASAVQG